jgi:3-oxoacyl-[acyl-carrier-protein] synthase II
VSRPLAITGLGVVSVAGFGAAALRERVLAGGTALARRSRIHSIDPGWTGTVPDSLEPLAELPDGRPQPLFLAWAQAAAHEAMTEADLLARVNARRIGLVVGSNLEDHPLSLADLVAELGDRLKLDGPRLATSLACASSHGAFSLARMLLEGAAVDAVVVGGADVLTPRVAATFAQVHLICPAPSVPFSERTGTSLGEGAAMFVLEREPARGRAAIAWLLGEGLAADAHHETAPEPRGRGTTQAIRAALAHAGVDASAVDLVIAHGTGTAHNDSAEASAIIEVFGHAARPAVTALKGMLGHAQGAAGAIELAATLLARQHGKVPSIPGLERPCGPLGEQLVTGTPPPSRACARLLIDGAGFGGAHAAVLVGDPLADVERQSTRRHRIASWSTIDLAESEPDWRRSLRGIDLRALDPIARILVTTTARALDKARAPRRFATGLIVGQRCSNQLAVARMREQVERHGLSRTIASSFVDSLMVMPAGACTRMLELWGPFGLTCADASAGLLATVWALAQLEQQPHLTAMVAACVDEAHGTGMACVVGDRGEIEIVGHAIARHGSEALANALVLAGLDSSGTTQSLAHACEHLQAAERGQTIAVVSEDQGNVAVALVLARL